MKKIDDVELISVKDMSFAFETENIIDRADFVINRGDVITIVGPNGGGKTTLLRLLMGQLTPQKGRVKVHAAADRVFGYVPQYSTMDPSYPITAFEVVLTGRIRSFGFYSRSDRKAAMESLEAVGLEDTADKSFSELSGGQRQRVLIARALAPDPEVLVLDEPTANIDTEAEKQLNVLLRKLGASHTILLVTHDLGFVNEMTTRVLCVNRHVKEHPVDSLDDGLITAAYGRQMKVVRHDHEVHQ